MKSEVTNLRKDVDYLKSTDSSLLIERVDDLDSPGNSDIPPSITGDVQRDSAVEENSSVETNEDLIAEYEKEEEKSIFGNFPNQVETIVHQATQTRWIRHPQHPSVHLALLFHSRRF